MPCTTWTEVRVAEPGEGSGWRLRDGSVGQRDSRGAVRNDGLGGAGFLLACEAPGLACVVGAAQCLHGWRRGRLGDRWLGQDAHGISTGPKSGLYHLT